MLKVSDLLIGNDVDSYADLEKAVEAVARQGEMFFQMDVKPPFPDTPENWEEKLEARFTSAR